MWFGSSNRALSKVRQVGTCRRVPSLRMIGTQFTYAATRRLGPVRTVSSSETKKYSNITQRTQSTCAKDINPEIDAPKPSELFSFTSGRFVQNEEQELAQRYREFNINELARRAARAVQADRCLSIKKLPDGFYNRILLLTMDNGKEVVAKIPSPNSGRPHFTIASEVATMKFSTEYDWSSRAQDTPVGAEFILMEKLDGVELRRVWPKMCREDMWEVVKAITAYQESWASVTFEQYGSLYFAEDFKGENIPALMYTDEKGRRVKDSRFVIGPSTSREMFDLGRDGIDFDRGPWNSLEEYHAAIAHRELACVQHFPPLQPSSMTLTLRGIGLFQSTREKKVDALKSHLKLLKYILPANRSLGSSHFCHNALHGGNILVGPDDPCRIVGIIDWQSTEVSPVYSHIHQPPFIKHFGPHLRGLDPPARPPDYYAMFQGDATLEKLADSIFWGNILYKSYERLIGQRVPKMSECFEFQRSISCALLGAANHLSIDGEALLHFSLVCDLEKEWEMLPGTQDIPSPLTLTTTDRDKIDEDAMNLMVSNEVMERIHTRLGRDFPHQGFVLHHNYRMVMEALSRARKEVLAEVGNIRRELESLK
ncbi:hypothetical protein E4U30_004966 [Claviceps sp. LM220 group G6]|nr:hypothetical protein E4U30_004966 [Claviceps sp. LM220 group G6]